MRKVILIIASIAGAAVIAFAVYLSQLGASTPSDAPDNPSVVTESPQPGDEQAPGEERPPGEENDQTGGKPGEVKP